MTDMTIYGACLGVLIRSSSSYAVGEPLLSSNEI